MIYIDLVETVIGNLEAYGVTIVFIVFFFEAALSVALFLYWTITATCLVGIYVLLSLIGNARAVYGLRKFRRKNKAKIRKARV